MLNAAASKSMACQSFRKVHREMSPEGVATPEKEERLAGDIDVADELPDTSAFAALLDVSTGLLTVNQAWPCIIKPRTQSPQRNFSVEFAGM